MGSHTLQFIFVVFVLTLVGPGISIIEDSSASETTPAITQDTIPKPSPKLDHKKGEKQWIHTMEASVQTFPKTETNLGITNTLVTWLGWIVASVFFIVLLSLQIKMKKREHFLLRGGDRELLVFPPARNRRRRPR